MKRTISLLLSLLAITGFTQPGIGSEPASDLHTSPHRFNLGEEFEFRLSYGWFTVGHAQVNVENKLINYDDRPCYKVNVWGGTAGFLGAFTHVDDTWGAFVDAEHLVPLMSFSDISEGKYMRQEEIHFDHDNRTIRVDMVKKHKKRPTKYFEFENQINDLLSGYLNIRNTNFGQLQMGDTLRYPAYYDEEFYDFGLVYAGKEELNSKVGDLMTYHLIPILPENKIFPGENPISVWISADNSQLPLKVEARMFFGNASCELVGYKNIKYGPDFE